MDYLPAASNHLLYSYISWLQVTPCLRFLTGILSQEASGAMMSGVALCWKNCAENALHALRNSCMHTSRALTGVWLLCLTAQELSEGASAATFPLPTGWALLTSQTRPAMYLGNLLCVCFCCNVLLFMMWSWQNKFKWIVTIIHYHLFSEILANACCFLHRLFITKQVCNLLFPCRQRLSGWKTSLTSNWRSRQKGEEHFNSLL